MPRAEVGSTKHLNNKLKSKGLQRLRWYCQVCEKQCRDENGFKCHVQSESHVRQMMVVGENSKKFISDFSNQFQRDFLQLLRTAHGEKAVHANHFYQTYIADKNHIHLNASRWASLTEFVKFLGREGICRVTEDEKGLYIAWIDNSPEALRRKDAVRRKERQDKGDEEREQRLIQEQVERARQEADSKAMDGERDEARTLQRAEGEKISLNFGSKPKSSSSPDSIEHSPEKTTLLPGPQTATPPLSEDGSQNAGKIDAEPVLKVSFTSAPVKSKNVFSAKKNPLASKKLAVQAPPKKISEMERIMKEEIERKRSREAVADFKGDIKRRRM